MTQGRACLEWSLMADFHGFSLADLDKFSGFLMEPPRTSDRTHQPTLLNFGLNNIEHPEHCCLHYRQLNRKPRSQTSFKKALYSPAGRLFMSNQVGLARHTGLLTLSGTLGCCQDSELFT
jgi:hypothetical protein